MFSNSISKCQVGLNHQSVIWNSRAVSRIFKKGHFWLGFFWKYCKITLLWEKRAFLSNIMRGSVGLQDADFF